MHYAGVIDKDRLSLRKCEMRTVFICSVCKVRRSVPTLCIGALAALLVATSGLAKTYETGTDDGAEFVPAKGVECPCPEIPSELKEESMKCCCVARFNIDQEGKCKVKLVSSSGSDEIDDITLRTLRKWKFKPAMLDGKPVPSTRRIKVEFQVD